jgi:hypothetical protein
MYLLDQQKLQSDEYFVKRTFNLKHTSNQVEIVKIGKDFEAISNEYSIS